MNFIDVNKDVRIFNESNDIMIKYYEIQVENLFDEYFDPRVYGVE